MMRSTNQLLLNGHIEDNASETVQNDDLAWERHPSQQNQWKQHNFHWFCCDGCRSQAKSSFCTVADTLPSMWPFSVTRGSWLVDRIIESLLIPCPETSLMMWVACGHAGGPKPHSQSESSYPSNIWGKIRTPLWMSVEFRDISLN